ncbi:hypothetical protein M427DRAFT_53191 [Gonapodya prolifera JEL478]|uniref:Methyltransferase domain-containing protein n=1 Tax=Gonapodya prolifera (strain JEL478) TaxID=1344416 RepID=A0A139AR59_GONPJ|nr:hypothetical protein M427DRAFT_53191 [Gonapodya prolifera JEL478]|eukprot:KXS19237.1 hypothetical protein M427DRAFT_53191 [Gonapodya prolifera JEL478]
MANKTRLFTTLLLLVLSAHFLYTYFRPPEPLWPLQRSSAGRFLTQEPPTSQYDAESPEFSGFTLNADKAGDGAFVDVLITRYDELYKKYSSDLKAVRRAVADWCREKPKRTTPEEQVTFRQGWAHMCISDDIELEVGYLRIREAKPKVVWEISPADGFSTFWIISALKANGNGAILYSFDLANDPTQHLPLEMQKSIDWRFKKGDFHKQIDNVLAETPEHSPNYIFLDSYHSKDFAQYYTTELFRMWPDKHIHISLHDVYNPSFWNDNIQGRDLNVHPPWMPNEEGLAVLDWLVYQLPSTYPTPWQSRGVLPVCNLFTLASARFPRLFKRFVAMRSAVLGDEHRHSVRPGEPPMDVAGMGNPTLYWEMGCKIR